MPNILVESNIAELKEKLNDSVHNDYSLEVPPVFEIYADRIEITSYGGLPTGLSEDDFFGCRSMPRNRELMRVFKDLDFVEQLGSGMTRILSVYDKDAFSFTSHYMTVKYTYPEGYAPQDSTQDNTQDELSTKILSYCEEARTKAEITAFCGYKDGKSFAKRYLQPLLQNNLLRLSVPDKPTSKNQKYVSNSRRDGE